MAYGKSLELQEIPTRTVVMMHEHAMHNTQRYAGLGGFANRATRRAWVRARRGRTMPAATLTSYTRPVVDQEVPA